MVGRYDIPRRDLGARMREHFAIDMLIGIPVRALANVGSGYLPILLRRIDPLE